MKTNINELSGRSLTAKWLEDGQEVSKSACFFLKGTVDVISSDTPFC